MKGYKQFGISIKNKEVDKYLLKMNMEKLTDEIQKKFENGCVYLPQPVEINKVPVDLTVTSDGYLNLTVYVKEV